MISAGQFNFMPCSMRTQLRTACHQSSSARQLDNCHPKKANIPFPPRAITKKFYVITHMRAFTFSFSSMRGFPDIGLVLVLRLISGFRGGADVAVLARDMALPGRRGCANEARGASSSSEESLSEVVSDVSLFGPGGLKGAAVNNNVC